MPKAATAMFVKEKTAAYNTVNFALYLCVNSYQ